MKNAKHQKGEDKKGERPAYQIPMGDEIEGVHVALATPRRLPKAHRLKGRVVILDVAFASGKPAPPYPSITHELIEQLGRRLACYLDHHDSEFHADFAQDPRFMLATKAQHGACPEMVTPELVEWVGEVDTIVCHDDFDGIASAAKWLNKGHEPYEGCDADAYAIDTRLGTPSEAAARMDRALRGNPRSFELRWQLIKLMLSGLKDEALWAVVDEAGQRALALEQASDDLAEGYRQLSDEVAFVDVTYSERPFDRTHLLLKGQERAKVAVMRAGDSVSFAAGFHSGLNFLTLFGLSGGMPTVVSLPVKRLGEALTLLGVEPSRVARLLSDLELS